MPKVHDTRKHRARELLRLATNGPDYSPNFDGTPLTVEQITHDYRLWSSSWLVPLLHKLVPELRKKETT